MYQRGLAITPHDTNVLTGGVTTAIYVGGAGDVTLILVDDANPVTFKAVPVGTVLNVHAKIVKSTGTTATLMLALYQN